MKTEKSLLTNKKRAWVDALYRQYSSVIYRMLRYCLYHDRIDMSIADDILHETFLLLFEKADKLANHDHIERWLRITAMYLYRNYRRKYRSRVNAETTINEAHEFSNEITMPNISVEMIMKELSKEERTLFTRAFLEEHNVKELSNEYDVSYSTMWMRINRLRKHLKTIASKEN